METSKDTSPAPRQEPAADQTRAADTTTQSDARVYTEVEDQQRSSLGKDKGGDSSLGLGIDAGSSTDLLTDQMGKRDSSEKGLATIEINGRGGTEMTFDPAQREDKLVFRGQQKNADGKQVTELFSGRPDGIVEQSKLSDGNGSTLERQYEPHYRTDGLKSEHFHKSRGGQTLERKFDAQRSPEGISEETIERTDKGSTTKLLYDGRIDGLISSTKVADVEGAASTTLVYEDGIVIQRGADGKTTTGPTENKTVEDGTPPGDLNRLPTDDRTATTDSSDGIAGQVTDRRTDSRPLVKQLRNEDFSRVAKEVLARIDTANTGRVTRQQLSAAIQDPSFTGQHAQALAAMHRSFTSLQNLSGEFRLDSRVISAADLDTYEQRRQVQSQRETDASLLRVWGDNNLSRFDRTGNGVTRADINAGLADSNTSEFDRQQLTRINANFSAIASAGGDSNAITTSSINRYADQQFGTPQGRLDSQIFGTVYRVNESQSPQNSRELYADRANPLESIDPDAITQGMIGNCYFEAALASVAQSNPQLIRDAIRDNGNGTFTVTFPGARDYPVTITAPTEAEQGLYNGGSPRGLWASVMEKAHGELYNQGLMARIFGRSNTPTEGADGGGIPGRAMSILTGQSYENFYTSGSQQTIRDQLVSAFSDTPPRAVVAGTDSRPFFGDRTTADGYARQHAYSIVGFDANGPGGGTVTVRNPWNEGQGTGGTSQIPLSIFMRNFGDISVERRR